MNVSSTFGPALESRGTIEHHDKVELFFRVSPRDKAEPCATDELGARHDRSHSDDGPHSDDVAAKAVKQFVRRLNMLNHIVILNRILVSLVLVLHCS